MIVVSDTSPINYLIQIDKLLLLKNLFEEIFIPTTVYDELVSYSKNIAPISQGVSEGWIHIQSPVNELSQKMRDVLDDGEAKAIALALELNASLVLIDERKGAIVARKLNLKTFGLIGVLVEAKKDGNYPCGKTIFRRSNTAELSHFSTILQTNTIRSK